MKFKILQAYSARERWFLLALFAGSLGLRLGYLREISSSPLFTYLRLDELFHYHWALSVAHGNILGDEVFFRAPLYPYVLGGLFALFGDGLILPKIFQHLLGSVSVVLVYALTRNLFGSKAAVVASLLAATDAMLISLEGKLLFEPPLIFLLVGFAFLLLQAMKQPTVLRWLLAGLLLGLVCITRPVFLPWIAIVPIARWWATRKRGASQRILAPAAAFIGGSLIAIAPITVRNAAVGHEFVLIASQGGFNFFLGNNPEADGMTAAMPGLPGSRWERRDVEAPVRETLGRSPTASEIDAYWFRRGTSFVASQPLAFLSLTLKKLALFWTRVEIPNNDSFYLLTRSSALLSALPTGFWLIGPLGLTGIWIAWRRRQGRMFALLIASYVAVISLFFVCDRFRAPILPFLCMFAGAAAAELAEAVRTRQRREVVLVAGALALSALLVEPNPFHLSTGNRAVDDLRLGDAQLDAGRYDSAIALYRAAAEIQPLQRDLSLNWGVAAWKSGRPAEAIDRFRMEFASYPTSFDAAANLSHLFYLTGHADSSRLYSARAIRLKPYAPEGYLDLVFAACDRGALAEAESTFAQYRRAGGASAPYETSVLAGVHLLEGKLDTAEAEYRRVLAALKPDRQPGYTPENRFSAAPMLGDDEQTFRAKVLYSIGNVFLRKGQPDSAAAYLRMATGDWPGFADAWLDLAVSEGEMDDTAAAAEAFRRGLGINPASAHGWFNYGLLLESMERLEDSQAALQRAVDLDSGFIQAKSALDQVRRKLKSGKLPSDPG